MMRFAAVLFSLLIVSPAVHAQAFDVPFDGSKNQVVFRVTLGANFKAFFLIDTGLTPSAIDIKTARALGYEINESSPVAAGGLGGETVYIYPTVITDLSVEGMPVPPQQAMAMDLSALSAQLGQKVDGILGFGFLRRRVTRIDYAGQRLHVGKSLADVGVSEDLAAYTAPLVLVPGDILPKLDVTVGGRTLAATIDTGSSRALEIFSPSVDKLGLTETVAAWKTRSEPGAYGAVETREGILPAVRIGPLEVAPVQAAITPPRGNPRARQGNIGNQLLRGQDITFDYVGRRLIFMRVE